MSKMAMLRRDIQTVYQLQSYLEEKKTTDRIYHYTTYESLVSILSYRCFRISRLDLLNDKAEQQLTMMSANEKSYIMSFSNSPKEYVSMWAMYGNPSGIKLRIDFPIKSFISSINNNFYFDNKCEDHIGRHRIDMDPVTKKDFRISDVVYFDKKKNELSHNTKPFSNIHVDRDAINSLAGFIKYDAWEFEKEIRLRVLLNDDVDRIGGNIIKYIYAKIDDFLISQINVTYNPWISDKLKIELETSINRLSGHLLSHQLSANHGEIGNFIFC